MNTLGEAISHLLIAHSLSQDPSPTHILIPSPLPAQKVMHVLNRQYEELLKDTSNISHSFCEQLQSAPDDIRATLFEMDGLQVLAHLTGKVPKGMHIVHQPITPALSDKELLDIIRCEAYHRQSMLAKLVEHQSLSLQRALDLYDEKARTCITILHARTYITNGRRNKRKLSIESYNDIIYSLLQHASAEALQKQLTNLEEHFKHPQSKRTRAVLAVIRQSIKEKKAKPDNLRRAP